MHSLLEYGKRDRKYKEIETRYMQGRELPCPAYPACPISLSTIKKEISVNLSWDMDYSSSWEEYPDYEIRICFSHCGYSLEKICCGYSLWGSSNQYSQQMFSRNKTNINFRVGQVDFDHLLTGGQKVIKFDKSTKFFWPLYLLLGSILKYFKHLGGRVVSASDSWPQGSSWKQISVYDCRALRCTEPFTITGHA